MVDLQILGGDGYLLFHSTETWKEYCKNHRAAEQRGWSIGRCFAILK